MLAGLLPEEAEAENFRILQASHSATEAAGQGTECVNVVETFVHMGGCKCSPREDLMGMSSLHLEAQSSERCIGVHGVPNMILFELRYIK